MLGGPVANPGKVLAALPHLIKNYLRAGTRFSGTAVVDRQYGTTDLFVVMPVAEISERYLAHFSGNDAVGEAA